VITQNVDGLHEKAGTARLVALHGRISDVVCLGCGEHSSRAVLQQEMAALNPDWLSRNAAAPARPDGDVELDDTADFKVPTCSTCGGNLKPDVVFFGENVPRKRVERCYELVDAAEALLVLGTSLTVMSGFRFVRHAAKRGLPVVIVNRGVTRGDDLATYKLEHGTSEFLDCDVWDAGSR
jgi:NAD-dependent SIR2 family protein deacetylase